MRRKKVVSIKADSNVRWHDTSVTRIARERKNGHRGAIVWLTGLPGSGKSTLANTLQKSLHDQGHSTYVLDGDNIRHGLCGDLGFTDEDRTENIRRVGEVARLMYDAGLILIVALISPFREDRRRARRLVEAGSFHEVYCRCALSVCEARDVKGLYAKARAGEIPEFTGISSPYEEPENPELIVDTDRDSPEVCLQRVMDYLVETAVIPRAAAPA